MGMVWDKLVRDRSDAIVQGIAIPWYRLSHRHDGNVPLPQRRYRASITTQEPPDTTSACATGRAVRAGFSRATWRQYVDAFDRRRLRQQLGGVGASAWAIDPLRWAWRPLSSAKGVRTRQRLTTELQANHTGSSVFRRAIKAGLQELGDLPSFARLGLPCSSVRQLWRVRRFADEAGRQAISTDRSPRRWAPTPPAAGAGPSIERIDVLAPSCRLKPARNRRRCARAGRIGGSLAS